MIKRYTNSTVFDNGTLIGVSNSELLIRDGVINGVIRYDEIILTEGVRLDQLAAQRYGDPRLWWLIAAASGIGWYLQTPPGTLIKIPNIQDVGKIVS